MPIINTLICHRDIERAPVCLQSFSLACQDQVQFRFFSDGSLTKEDEAYLLVEFPGSTIVQKAEMRANIEHLLKDHPLCSAMSQGSVFGLKQIEMPLYCQHHLGEERFVYIDTDIMFFRVMSNWQELWKRNLYLCERRVVLSGSPRVIIKKAPLLVDVNAGMISFDMSLYELDFIEWFLGQNDMRNINEYLSEQTCWGLLGARAQQKGASFWQPHPNEIVSDHAFKNLRKTQLALHFIAGHKSRIEEFIPRALSRRTIQHATSQRLRFIEAKRMTYIGSLFSSVINRYMI
jgi:hypothetical protein